MIGQRAAAALTLTSRDGEAQLSLHRRSLLSDDGCAMRQELLVPSPGRAWPREPCIRIPERVLLGVPTCAIIDWLACGWVLLQLSQRVKFMSTVYL